MGVNNVQPRFEQALIEGRKIQDFKGTFGRYLIKQSITHRSNGVVFGGFIYWYRGDTLITVIPLAQRWHKYLKRKVI
jgi:hypothetical protein